MILSRAAIIEGIREGTLRISPFDERQLGTNSYDVRLGTWFAYIDPKRLYSNEIYDQHDEDQMARLWTTRQVAFGTGFILAPYQTVLGHTLEFIGSTGLGDIQITSNFHTRSGSKRNLFDCNGGAGYGDIGYDGRWTVEITNHHPFPLMLRPGQRIGQIEFIVVEGQAHRYGESQYSGKYGRDESNWTPEDMLPKSWKDWDVDMVLNGNVQSFYQGEKP